MIKNNILHFKQFGFQNGHSTDHTVVRLVDEIIGSFENSKYTLGVLIDVSEAFNTVDNSILLKKLEQYCIADRNHRWVKSYLSYRRQFIQFNEKETISCGLSLFLPKLIINNYEIQRTESINFFF